MAVVITCTEEVPFQRLLLTSGFASVFVDLVENSNQLPGFQISTCLRRGGRSRVSGRSVLPLHLDTSQKRLRLDVSFGTKLESGCAVVKVLSVLPPRGASF